MEAAWCTFKKKSYGDEARDFHNKKIPKVGSNYTCLRITLIDFVIKKDENYYQKVIFANAIHIKFSLLQNRSKYIANSNITNSYNYPFCLISIIDLI